MSFVACEKELLQPDSNTNVSIVKTDIEKNIAFRITFDQTTAVTTSQWPPTIIKGLKKTSEQEALLEYFSNIKYTYKLDTIGYFSVEGEYLEGNSSIWVPMQMWEEIKDKTLPQDPTTNPIRRFILDKGVYTAYGVDGEIVHTAQFSMEDFLVDTTNSVSGKISNRLGLPSIKSKLSESDMRVIAEKNGLKYQFNSSKSVIVLERTIIQEQSSIRTKSFIDVSSGAVLRTASYDEQGKITNAIIFHQKPIGNYLFPATIVHHVMGKLYDGSWGIKRTITEIRNNIILETR